MISPIETIHQKSLRISTPLGEMILVATPDRGLSHALFVDTADPRLLARTTVTATQEIFSSTSVLQQAAQQITEYFSGTRKEFTILLHLEGSAFDKKVWSTLEKIPFGSYATYGKIAETLNMPQSARSIGAACGRNPIALVIPCHRVVGSTYKSGQTQGLVGYAGGLQRKNFLLQHEMSY